MIVRVDSQRPTPRSLAPVLEALSRGDVIIYPTDTGYAFGCSLQNPKGIARLRRLKGFPETHPKPLSMLLRDVSEIGRYGHMGNRVFRFVRRLLPGPYTIVLRATSDVPRTMKNRGHEVGVRIPEHPVCAMLCAGLGEPLLSGSVTPAESEFSLEDSDELERRYARDVRIVVDGGPLWPDPSTVLRLVDDTIEVLRPGQGPIPT